MFKFLFKSKFLGFVEAPVGVFVALLHWWLLNVSSVQKVDSRWQRKSQDEGLTKIGNRDDMWQCIFQSNFITYHSAAQDRPCKASNLDAAVANDSEAFILSDKDPTNTIHFIKELFCGTLDVVRN